MNERVRPELLSRKAVVYVRQSNPHQAREHDESRRRQHALLEEAINMGFARVEEIVDDVGVSASLGSRREGFDRLLRDVGSGHVGCVFALESSRLARNGVDWHTLLEICACVGTMVKDADGLWDPREANDRLVLGIKGTVSEFEIGLLQRRAQESIVSLAARGEVVTNPPIGYIVNDNREFEKTPDAMVRAALDGVFEAFRRLGSLGGVLRELRAANAELPRYRRRQGCTRVVWDRPNASLVRCLLNNPTYAGIYVYGRTRCAVEVSEGRARKARQRRVPREQWRFVHDNHHEGYISAEEYEANQRRLADNRAGDSARGAARKGAALLSGLLRCAQCGKRLSVTYPRKNQITYLCAGGDAFGGESEHERFAFAGKELDEAVVDEVLAVLGPIGIEESLTGWERISDERRAHLKDLRESLEEARRREVAARLRFDAVDPANRAVAARLEQRWDDALLTVEQAAERLREAERERERLTDEERGRLIELACDVRAVWEHPATEIKQKKRIIRCVIKSIVIDRCLEKRRINAVIHWEGGVHTRLSVRALGTGVTRKALAPEQVEAIRVFATVFDDEQAARLLNRHGLLTGRGLTWTAERLYGVRRYHRIPACPSADRRYGTLAEVARRLNLGTSDVKRLIERGVLPAARPLPSGPYVIDFQDVELPGMQAAIAALGDDGQTDLFDRLPRDERNQSGKDVDFSDSMPTIEEEKDEHL